MTPRIVPDLVEVEQELFELPQKVCLLYLSCSNDFSYHYVRYRRNA